MLDTSILINKASKWVDIPYANGKYIISDTGLVVHKRSGHALVPHAINQGGYLAVTLSYYKNVTKKFYLHRLLAEAFIPNPNNYLYVHFKDYDIFNFNLSNLEWVEFLPQPLCGKPKSKKSKVVSTVSANLKPKISKKVVPANTDHVYCSAKVASRLSGVSVEDLCSFLLKHGHCKLGYCFKKPDSRYYTFRFDKSYIKSCINAGLGLIV